MMLPASAGSPSLSPVPKLDPTVKRDRFARRLGQGFHHSHQLVHQMRCALHQWPVFRLLGSVETCANAAIYVLRAPAVETEDVR